MNRISRVATVNHEQQWRRFLHRCYAQRIQQSRFAHLSSQLHKKCPLTSRGLCICLLSIKESYDDPLLPLYIYGLLSTGLIRSYDFLLVIVLRLEGDKDRREAAQENGAPTAHRLDLLTHCNHLMTCVSRYALHQDHDVSDRDCRLMIQVLTKFMTLMCLESFVEEVRSVDNVHSDLDSAYSRVLDHLASLLLVLLSKAGFVQSMGTLQNTGKTHFVLWHVPRSVTFASAYNMLIKYQMLCNHSLCRFQPFSALLRKLLHSSPVDSTYPSSLCPSYFKVPLQSC